MKILVLDNYDSFTYNLVQYLRELHDGVVDVFRNDEITVKQVDEYDAIILSPGPGLPGTAGVMPELIYYYAPHKPILGVCLGMQAIGEAFGRSLTNLDQVYHGIATPIKIIAPEDPLFENFGHSFDAGRYHSWIVARSPKPDDLLVTAIDKHSKIMALRHKTYPTWGVQFHPESIMTPKGKDLLANFLKQAKIFHYSQKSTTVTSDQ